MSDTDNASTLENLFSDFTDFTVIGLTGRTGSGCSTVANILSEHNLRLPDPEHSHYEGNEQRKYRIIKKYIESNWCHFEWLQVRTIITKFILKMNFSEFSSFVADCLGESVKNVHDKIKSIRDVYQEAHTKVHRYDLLLESTAEELRQKKREAYEIYFQYLPRVSNDLRDGLKGISVNAYTIVYQAAGDNIRASGKANSSKFDPSKVFIFFKTINKIIKSVRSHRKSLEMPCRVVIDAIRNPYEAEFLRERYSHFYLLSVNTENSNRLDYLRKSHKFSEHQIEALDRKEYPGRLDGYQKFCSQDIQKCIEISDIHINNPKMGDFGINELKSQVAWYVSLMLHPGIITPTSLENAMQIAYSVKKSSGCISRQVGAVVTDKNYSVKSVGWNNPPRGQVPCILRNAEHLLTGADPSAYSEYEKNNVSFRGALAEKFDKHLGGSRLRGRNLSFCFKDLQNEMDNKSNQVHTRSLHAEENAFLQISKYGGAGLEGGVLFTTASPCELCSKKAYQIGISKVVFIDPYPGIAKSHVLSSGGNVPELVLFRGAIGVAFHRLYRNVMPYKEELKTALGIKKAEDKKQLRIRRLVEENEKLKEKVRELSGGNRSKPSEQG